MPSDFEVLSELVREQLGDDTIAWGLFRVDDSRKDDPRRVVWIPTDFRCDVPSALTVDADTGARGGSMLVDHTTVECVITGVDFEDACLIRRQVLNACRTALGTSSVPLDGGYVTEQEGKSGYMWGAAAKIVQRFEWQMLVPRLQAGWPLDGSGYEVTVTEIDQTGQLQASASTHVDDPTLIIPPAP